MSQSIKDIVVEEINKYFSSQMLSESLFETESEEDKKDVKSTEKMSAAQRKAKERIEKANKRDGKEVGSNVASDVREFLNDPSVNVSDVMVQATGLAPTSASSLGAKIAKGERPVKAKLAQTVHQIQNKLG